MSFRISAYSHPEQKKSNCLQGLMLVAVLAFLGSTSLLFAQHGGGGRGVGGGGGLSGGGRPSGVSDKDDLKDFHQALAVQASAQQSVEFAALMKSIEVASRDLQDLLQGLSRDTAKNESEALAVSSQTTNIVHALEKVQSDNKKFLDGFSAPQKSGLKEATRKLLKADSDLAEQSKMLDLATGASPAVDRPTLEQVQVIEKAFTTFKDEQSNLGEEMGVVLPGDGQDLAFKLAPVKSSLNFDNLSVALSASSVVFRAAADSSQDIFKLETIVDLTDWQQNATTILRSQLNKFERCGERIELQDATLTPSIPASVIIAHLHYERWMCPGPQPPNELVEGNGTVEMKLTAGVAQDGTLQLLTQIKHVDAEGSLAESLRSGSLGDTLREKIARALLAAVQAGADFKTTIPPAVLASLKIKTARFEKTGAGNLNIVLDGDIKLSDEQAKLLSIQLNRLPSSQASLPQPIQ